MNLQKILSVSLPKMCRISRLDQMSRRHRQRAIRLHDAAHQPPPLTPPQGQRGPYLSTTRMGQTRRFGRWVNGYNNKEIQKNTLENN